MSCGFISVILSLLITKLWVPKGAHLLGELILNNPIILFLKNEAKCIGPESTEINTSQLYLKSVHKFLKEVNPHKFMKLEKFFSISQEYEKNSWDPINITSFLYISEYMFYLNPNGSKEVIFTVSIPDNTKYGKYTGYIKILLKRRFK